jgi:predicted dehydrogenase/nucleoside-diphosphate-sugar epimerase
VSRVNFHAGTSADLHERRIALIGTGRIAVAHALALSGMRGCRLVAVADPQEDRASLFAQRFGIPQAYAAVEGLLDAQSIDAAHVLTPPDHHAEIVRTLALRGVDVLVEKPMAGSLEECDVIMEACGGTMSGSVYVNHNLVFHPAFVKLSRTLQSGQLGPATSIAVTYAMPLRQIESGPASHWMFRRPANLLLEQAVHPLSQIVSLAGPVLDFRVMTGRTRIIGSGRRIPSALSVLLACGTIDVQLHLQFGSSFPRWDIVTQCTDGVIRADILANRLTTQIRTPWVAPLDHYLDGHALIDQIARQDRTNLFHELGAVLKIRDREEPFAAAMQTSLEQFHHCTASLRPPVNGPEGARAIVDLCEKIADAAFPIPAGAPAVIRQSNAPYETVVIGGSGFIGGHVVRKLAGEGRSVGIAARHVENLSTRLFPTVGLIQADLRNRESLRAALRGARYVVNATSLETGEDWTLCKHRTEEAVHALADACLDTGIERLVHFSSVAALFLGNPSRRISDSHPVDPHPQQRALYARAKAHADLLLLTLHQERNLPVCILRPPIVIGEGGTPFHTGVGLFVNGRHCFGWNHGRNPLPILLASDLADAALAALTRPGVEGRWYNLTGDVGLSAREYIAELAKALRRPLVYHPQPTEWLWAKEIGKWGIKKLAGRTAWLASYRDLRSRSFLSQIDASAAKRDLVWNPVSERERFIAEGIAVHGRQAP